jgi:hypothetical protein
MSRERRMSSEHRIAQPVENRIKSVKDWEAIVPAGDEQPPNMRATITRKVALTDGTVVPDAEYRFAMSWVYKYPVEDHQGITRNHVLFHRARYYYVHPETGEK